MTATVRSCVMGGRSKGEAATGGPVGGRIRVCLLTGKVHGSLGKSDLS